MALPDFTPPDVVFHESRDLAEIPSSEVRPLVAALEDLKIPTSIFEVRLSKYVSSKPPANDADDCGRIWR